MANAGAGTGSTLPAMPISNGLDENTAFANAFRYRDYVVNAFNKDKPYDQFVMEQLAGDLMPTSGDVNQNYERLVATGFLVLGPKLLAEPEEEMIMDIVDEQIDVTSRAFMGLTTSCARCHDHKFDPIPTRDYYGLAGIFKSTKTMSKLATVAERSNGRSAMRRPSMPGMNIAAAPAPRKTNLTRRKIRKRRRHQKELNELRAQVVPPVPMALAVEDDKPGDTRVHIRGNYLTLGEIAPRHSRASSPVNGKRPWTSSAAAGSSWPAGSFARIIRSRPVSWSIASGSITLARGWSQSGQFRQARRTAHASGIARLAGIALRRERLVDQGDAPLDFALQRLSHEHRLRFRCRPRRPGRSAIVALSSAPFGSRGHPRRHAGGERKTRSNRGRFAAQVRQFQLCDQ